MSEEQTPQANPGSVMYPDQTAAPASTEESTPEGQTQEVQPEAVAKEDEGKAQEESKEESSKEAEEGKGEIEYKLKLSEESLLGKERVDEIAEFAKKHGLSNDAAQEVLSKQEQVVSEFMEGLREKHQEQVDAWYQEASNDSEIGGDNLKRSAERAKRAIETFGSEGLIAGLKETGYGNHPEVVRVFSKIGELIENDEIVMPGKSLQQRSKADVLYGNN